MKKHKIRTVPYRRKRQGKTDYKARLALLKSGMPRLVVRVTLKNIIAQVISYETAGDKILASVSTKELQKQGWTASRTNIPCAYALGKLIAKKAVANGVKKAVFDTGMQTLIPGGKVYAVLKGAVDGGLDIPHSDEVYPDEKRIAGEHITGAAGERLKASLSKIN